MSHGSLGERLTAIVVASGSLHLIWENAQAPLFAGYLNFWQHFWICLQAIPGDVVVTLLVYLLVAAWRRNVRWIERLTGVDLAVAGMTGAVIAVGLERQALPVGRWAYATAMPLIPGLQVGVTPVLQMAILLPLTFFLARIILTASKNI